MTRIYTKTGDRGETGLRGGRRVSKTHPRICACGEIDELNSVLGAAVASLPSARPFDGLRRTLRRVQEELFAVGAILTASPGRIEAAAAPSGFVWKVDAVANLEREIDGLDRAIKPLGHFILPGGAPAGAFLHLSRAVCRRAERSVAALAASETVPESVTAYLNRLSDFLFISARWVNAKLNQREIRWPTT